MRDNNGPKGKEAVNGILSGLNDLLQNLSNLAEKGSELQRDGSFTSPSGKDGRFRVGFNISTAQSKTGERSFKVEPYGDIRHDEQTGEARVNEWREPPTDVFEEDDHTLVVVEMPGVAESDATFALRDDVLTIEASNDRKRYRKEVLLSESYPSEGIRVTSRDGVFEVRLSR